jgi:molybdopterin converting factor small subunit
MSLVFMIPGPLRELAGDRAEVCVEGVEGAAGSVAEALSLLWAACPAVRDRVLTERGEVRPHINIFVDGQNIRDAGGLGTPVRDGAEIYILPAVSGG